MAQIILLLQELLTACQGLTAVLQTVRNLVQHVAQENVPFHITTQVDITNAVVTDATFGNQQINTNVLALVTTLTADFDALSAQIAALPQVGDPVTLPSSMPSGWSTANADATADRVWGYDIVGTGSSAASNLGQAGTFALYVGQNFVTRWWLDPKFVLMASGWWNWLNPSPTLVNFQAPIANILPDDDIKTWCNRETGLDFEYSDPDGGYLTWYDPDNSNWRFVLPWSNADFEFAKQGYPPIAGTTGPVWPGLANVTLGTPVAIAPGVTISEPMDGVIVTITSYPTKQGYFTFDDQISLRNAGALAFVTDDADEEFPQLLGFLNAIYCPKSMSHAAGVVFRASVDLVGTITPWTIA